MEQTVLHTDGLHLAKIWEDAQTLIRSDSLLGSSSRLPSDEPTDGSQDAPCGPVDPYPPQNRLPEMCWAPAWDRPVVPETARLGLWDLDAHMTLGSFPENPT